nr:nucleotide-binding domain containing protein [Auraticoccus cholistanensis]
MGAAPASAPAPAPRPAGGPVLAVSGSCSGQTRRQVEHARAAGWLVLPLPLQDADPVAAVTGPALDALTQGRSVVVASAVDGPTATPVPVAEVAGALAAVTRAAVTAGLTSRVVVCGGDTSSRVTTLLTATSLEVVANPVGNVVLGRLTTADPALDGLEVLLKGGQVGPVDLLELVRNLGGTR